jgi:hypothetical protein
MLKTSFRVATKEAKRKVDCKVSVAGILQKNIENGVVTIDLQRLGCSLMDKNNILNY